eukprot:3699524-Prymnesium_polylepis.1
MCVSVGLHTAPRLCRADPRGSFLMVLSIVRALLSPQQPRRPFCHLHPLPTPWKHLFFPWEGLEAASARDLPNLATVT